MLSRRTTVTQLEFQRVSTDELRGRQGRGDFLGPFAQRTKDHLSERKNDEKASFCYLYLGSCRHDCLWKHVQCA